MATARTRHHDSVDETELSSLSSSSSSSQPPSSKRARRSSSEPKRESNSGRAPGPTSVTDENIPSPTSLQIHLSTHAPTPTPLPAPDHAVKTTSDGSNSEQSNPHSRVPSGIAGWNWPDYNSDTRSPSPKHPSGIEGHPFPDNYDDTSSLSSPRVPSGIEGYYFPTHYRTEERSTSSSSESESDSTIMVNVAEAAKAFENQHHYFDDPDAMLRGSTIIQQAREIIGRYRASPTANDLSIPVIKAAKDYPTKGEDQFAIHLLAVLLNEARMVLKPDIEPGPDLTPNDFVPDPKPWKEDFLGTKTQAYFRAGSVPQAVPDKGSFAEIFELYPRLQTPRPDVIFGLDQDLLPKRYAALFKKTPPPCLTSGIHHPFLAGEFKTSDRPIGEAQLQCQRTGSALVAFSAAWNDEVEGEAHSEALTTLPEVDMDKETSTPDHDSFCFTVAIAPDVCTLYVNWREVWSGNAIYYHTTPIEKYALEYGVSDLAKKFQYQISNICDWGLLERAKKIYKQAGAVSKRKTGNDDDLPDIHPKRPCK